MDIMSLKVGIIGAGAMAQAITLQAVRNGFEVMVSNTRGPESLGYLIRTLECKAGTPEQAINFGDIVIAAVPLYAIPKLSKESLINKIVVDPINYFPHRDGVIQSLKNGEITTSELFAKNVPGAIIVKAFNSITVEDLHRDARPKGIIDRRAIPIASDNVEAKSKVANFIESIGFDVVDAGELSGSWRFERYRPVYCVALKQDVLKERLFATNRDTWVADGYWIFNRGV